MDWTNRPFRICPLYSLEATIEGKRITIGKVITMRGKLWVEPVLNILVY